MRRLVYARIRPAIVTPSQWLLREVRRAPLTRGFESCCIPNGLDTRVFRPIDRSSARRALRLPEDAKILMFSAFGLAGPRKGGNLMIEALRRLAAEGVGGVHLLLAGGGGHVLERDAPYPVHNLGHVEGESVMAAAYSAADVFVLPTRADNLPNVLLESIACGTPSVAFDVGGVPDVVRPGLTGWLAEPEDSADLAACIREAISNDEARKKMAGHCRRIAQEEYDVKLTARRYLRIYEDRIGERTHTG
jgi:glycosyltransferase involved in cell wall biosynthesis